MTENNLLSLIIFAPLAGAVINWLFGKKAKSEMFSGLVACGSILVSTIVAFYIAFVADGGAMFTDKPVLDQIWTWIQVGDFPGGFRPGNGPPVGHLRLFCYVCRASDPYFRHRLYAWRQGFLPLFRIPEPLYVLDADAHPGG